MERSMKIIFACLGAVIVLGAAALGTVFGIHLARTRPAPAEQTTAQIETLPADIPSEPETLPEETTAPETTEAPSAVPTAAAAATSAQAETTVPKETKTTAAPTTARKRAVTTTAAPTTAAAATAAAVSVPQETTYRLRVTGDDGATDVTGGGRYAPGTLVKVSMTPMLGYTFRRWSSSDKETLADGSTQSYTFRMPAKDISLRAVTYQRPQVSLVKGKGVASVSGARYYSPGDKVTVSAQMQQGYDFANWKSAPSGLDSNSRTYAFIMPDHSVTLTANGAPKTYMVRVSLGKGVRGVTGDGGHKVGEKVTVRVKMHDDYAFKCWNTPSGTFTDESYTFIMPANDVTLTAAATPKPKYTLTVDKGDGIRSVGGGGRYTVGSRVTVTCEPESGYTFVTWLSSDSYLVKDSFMKHYTFAMPGADVALTAYAEKTQYKLTLKKGEGIVSVTGEGTFTAGETVTVRCMTADGYTFSEWTAAGRFTVPNGKTQTYTFTMPESDMALTAKAVADVAAEPF